MKNSLIILDCWLRNSALALVTLCIFILPHNSRAQTDPKLWVELSLKCINQEYPNRTGATYESKSSLKTPSELHPIFYGCFDWHSAVHGHWAMARILNQYPTFEKRSEIISAFNRQFTQAKVNGELEYFNTSDGKTFERPYGYGWFLRLMQELRESKTPEAKIWVSTLTPLEKIIVERSKAYLKGFTQPTRYGTHPNTAFALMHFWDWALSLNDVEFKNQIEEYIRTHYLSDKNCPLAYEPSGGDFLSGCLAEAEIVQKIIPKNDFQKWLKNFLPNPIPENFLKFTKPTDPKDPIIGHLIGMGFHKSWTLRHLAQGLPHASPQSVEFLKASENLLQSSLSLMNESGYGGTHWLASFAIFALTHVGDSTANQQIHPPQSLEPIKEAEDQRNCSHPSLSVTKTESDRVKLAIALGRIRKPECIDLLLPLIKNPSSLVVLDRALFSAGQFGWSEASTQKRTQELIEAIQNQIPQMKTNEKVFAIEALGKLGLEKTPKLVETYLSDSSPAVRKAALLAHARYRMVLRSRNPDQAPPPISDEAYSKIQNLKNDPHPEVKESLAYVLARNKEKRGCELAVNFLNEKSVWTKYFALQALGNCENSAKNILKFTQNSNPLLQLAALNSLKQLKQSGLISTKKDFDLIFASNSSHVKSALLALIADNKQADPLWIKNALNSPSVEVQSAALIAWANWSLLQNSQTIPEELNPFAKSQKWELREAAAQASAVFGPHGKALLLQLAQDKDPRIIAAALEGISGISDADAFETIKKLLSHDALAARGAAIDALKERKEPARFEAAWNAYLLCSDEKWTESRETLSTILLSSENTNFKIEQAKTLAQDSSSSVRQSAIEWLRKKGENVSAPNSTALSLAPDASHRYLKNPKVHFHTIRGEWVIECFKDEAPIHVANFVENVRRKFYNGLIFHRVVPGFVIQGGDPDGSGWGGSGYMLREEINSKPFIQGALGMPRSQGFDTGGIQVFFNLAPTPHLDGQYTVFGQVIQGIENLQKIEKGDPILKAWVE